MHKEKISEVYYYFIIDWLELKMMVMMRNLQQSLSLANEHIQGGRT